MHQTVPTLALYRFSAKILIWSQVFKEYCSMQQRRDSELTLHSPVVTLRTTRLTFKNSTFYPHSVFLCFVWISEQTAIVSLYSIN